jgi:plasmid stability protein
MISFYDIISVSGEDVMASMVVRNIPEDVLDRLKDRAKREGKSTEQLAREALQEKARPSREEIVAESDLIRSMSKPVDLATMLRIQEELREELEERGPGPVDL